MAYTLKNTGQALDLKACVIVDEDGTTKDLCGNTITVHANVTTGEAAWKGTTRKFAQTSGSGYSAYGIQWSGTKPTVDVVDGFTVFVVMAGAGVGANQKSFLDIGASPGNGIGVFRNGSNRAYLRVGGVVGDSVDTTTVIPTDNVTPFSLAFDYRAASVGQVGSSGNSQAFFGLASGSLSSDSSPKFPTETTPPTGVRALNSIGGVGGQGYQNGKFHAVLVFQGERTLAQKQAIHNDWFNELIDGAPAVPQAPTNTAVSNVTQNSVTLSWTHNNQNVTLFRLSRESPSGAGNWQDQVNYAPGGSTTAYSQTIGGTITPGVQYRYRILAEGPNGSSAFTLFPAFTALSPATRKLVIAPLSGGAANATGVAGAVWAAPAGSAITGAKIGEFSGKTMDSAGGLKVPVADFGGSSLTLADKPVALLRNSTGTTGIFSCDIIDE